MFIIQFVNTYTQEIIREATFSNVDTIKNMITGFEKASNIPEPTYIIDNQQNTLNAEYLFHSVEENNNNTLYKLFFIVTLSKLQAKIKKTDIYLDVCFFLGFQVSI